MFFLVAARQYLLFDPKNGFKDVFWRNHLRAPQWYYNFKVMSQPPKTPKWPQNDFFVFPRLNTCCLTPKTDSGVYFEETHKTTYMLHQYRNSEMLGLKIRKFYFGSPGQRPDSKRCKKNFEEILKTEPVVWGDLEVFLACFSLEVWSMMK